MEKLFYQNQDEITGRFIVVDEDDNSIWAYLTFPFIETIDKDCFLGSRIKIEITDFDFEECKRKHMPPPMTKEFATKESYLPDLKEENIEVEWKENGNVILKINSKPFLYFVTDEKKGFCKSISKKGIYGNEWKEGEEIYTSSISF